MVRSTLALIAHDSKKTEMLSFVKLHRNELGYFRIIATRGTGSLVSAGTGLTVTVVHSETEGGDREIGDKIIRGEIHGLIFLRDPLISHSSEPDVNNLLRVCDVYKIPMATNIATAESILDSLLEDLQIWKREKVTSY